MSGDGSATGSGRGGIIRILHTRLGNNVSSNASALFFSYTSQAAARCSPAQIFGPCSTVSCPIVPTGNAGLPTSPTMESAGDITITGAGTSLAVLTFDAATMQYTQFQGSMPFFAGGDMIAVTGAGATVPAFAQSVIAPSDVILTAPACPSPLDILGAVGTCPDIDRSVAMNVAWTGAGPGNVSFLIEIASNTQYTNLSCTFTASDGVGTVPAAALATLENNASGTLTLSPLSQVRFSAGNYQTLLEVDGAGTSAFVNIAK